MKFRPAAVPQPPERSPPVRGAWIEILWTDNNGLKNWASPPVRGAWIEIVPSGQLPAGPGVAPREGGVD